MVAAETRISVATFGCESSCEKTKGLRTRCIKQLVEEDCRRLLIRLRMPLEGLGSSSPAIPTLTSVDFLTEFRNSLLQARQFKAQRRSLFALLLMDQNSQLVFSNISLSCL